jgi:diaminopropionate ammonia-lyase
MTGPLEFHRGLEGYEPTPIRSLDTVAAELDLGWVGMKDESSRLGLPAFKILGASWAVERALRAAGEAASSASQPGGAAGGAPGAASRGAAVHTLVAASAGNHGRAVARAAALRGLRARVFLPERSAPARRAAIESEGAEVVVGGDYEEAVAAAAAAGLEDGVVEIADVGASDPARWVVDGYATLFAEIDDVVDDVDVALVPVGVGSLAAAAVRWGTARGVRVVGVEPENAACLSASLAAGERVTIPTPGTTMAGLDCAEVSEAMWPELRDGISGVVTVTDAETWSAMAELAALGYAIGDCGAAPLAALRKLRRDRSTLPTGARVLLIATEGITDPDGYAAHGFARS